jgi:ATP-dependent DNA helicase RecQ
VVAADVRFHALAEEADEAFEAMEPGEAEEMHERFVVAHGGKVPDESEVEKAKKVLEYSKKTDTYIQTKELLLKESSIKEIATVRDMTEQTVWAHVEKLAEDGSVTMEQIRHLEPVNWDDAKVELFAAIDEHGDDKLKPIYEACDEVYDYNLVRLARMQWRLVQEGSGDEQPF